MRRTGLSAIVGLGIVTAIFMAIMSMFYLQHIPSKEDLARLEEEIRREHGFYLSAASALDVRLVMPEEDGQRTGLEIQCTLRPDIRRKPDIVDTYLVRIAESVLGHPDWAGRIAFVTVAHAPPLERRITRAAPQPAQS